MQDYQINVNSLVSGTGEPMAVTSTAKNSDSGISKWVQLVHETPVNDMEQIDQRNSVLEWPHDQYIAPYLVYQGAFFEPDAMITATSITMNYNQGFMWGFPVPLYIDSFASNPSLLYSLTKVGNNIEFVVTEEGSGRVWFTATADATNPGTVAAPMFFHHADGTTVFQTGQQGTLVKQIVFTNAAGQVDTVTGRVILGIGTNTSAFDTRDAKRVYARLDVEFYNFTAISDFSGLTVLPVAMTCPPDPMLQANIGDELYAWFRPRKIIGPLEAIYYGAVNQSNALRVNLTTDRYMISQILDTCGAHAIHLYIKELSAAPSSPDAAINCYASICQI